MPRPVSEDYALHFSGAVDVKFRPEPKSKPRRKGGGKLAAARRAIRWIITACGDEDWFGLNPDMQH